jgi:hypothetical protein
MSFDDGILQLSDARFERLLRGVRATDRVSGLTHSFYRYPARFSPQFARAAIEVFSRPGDVVLDPFMGGATTLVEARALGRIGIGIDINELSCFVATSKTSVLSNADIKEIREWGKHTVALLNMRSTGHRPVKWIEAGYQRNISTRRTWPIRKALELALGELANLKDGPRQVFARAVVLRTGQWALDCRSEVPTIVAFRRQLTTFLDEMLEGASAYREVVKQNTGPSSPCRTLILRRSAEGLENDFILRAQGAPKLVLTSPPYPGVHVVYHRWQIFGRKETPAPYWIANALDGNGLSYYTFGDRNSRNLKRYFDKALSSFKSIAKIAEKRTLVVQMVAFSEAAWQLPLYLETMESAGLREIKLANCTDGPDGRLWRTVPNRKWYAEQTAHGGAGKEVVLLHRRA